MANWRHFRPRPYDASKGIQLGAFVCLVDSADKQQQLFIGPDGGSMKLVGGAQLVQVISSEAPLGRALLGKLLEAPPYPSAKLCFLISGQLEDRALMARLIRVTAGELPTPMPKRAKALTMTTRARAQKAKQ